MGEGVITVMPRTQQRAKRYSSRDAVPLLQRWAAQQIGAAGYWYVPIPDSLGAMIDKTQDRIWAAADRAADVVSIDLGVDRGALGIFSKLLGIPYPLSVALVVFIGYALLRGAGLVPPLSGVVQ